MIGVSNDNGDGEGNGDGMLKATVGNSVGNDNDIPIYSYPQGVLLQVSLQSGFKIFRRDLHTTWTLSFRCSMEQPTTRFTITYRRT